MLELRHYRVQIFTWWSKTIKKAPKTTGIRLLTVSHLELADRTSLSEIIACSWRLANMIPFFTPLTTVRNIKPTEMSFISSNLDIDRNTRLANYKQQHGRQLYNIQMHVDAILACISISIPRTHVTCHMQQFIHHKLATFYSSQIRRPYNSNGILHD